MTHDEMIEAVARAIDDASKNARLGQDWQWFIPEARAAIRVIAPAAEQETVAKIVAWLRGNFGSWNVEATNAKKFADAIEAKWGKR